MQTIGVLISGRGSNLQALIDAQQRGELGGGRIGVVFSNVEAAAGLERARRAGIPVAVRDHRGLAREAFDGEVAEILKAHGVELVCLAGYMRLLSPLLLRAFPGRILNVHPALLPAFPGVKAQRQALEHGVKLSGATVHLVDENLDAGPIVAQEAVRVLSATPRTRSPRESSGGAPDLPARGARAAEGGCPSRARRVVEGE
jgi:phosphoribosylglycinamide formyltransferase-1